MASKSKSFNYMHSTGMSPATSAGKMTEILAKVGATHIQQIIKDAEIAGIEFMMPVAGDSMAFRVPVRWAQIEERMLEDFRAKKRRRSLGESQLEKSHAKISADAKRTAWRIALEWLKVQLSFVQSGARSPAEVFLADMILPNRDQTLGQVVSAEGLKGMLPAPKEK